MEIQPYNNLSDALYNIEPCYWRFYLRQYCCLKKAWLERSIDGIPTWILLHKPSNDSHEIFPNHESLILSSPLKIKRFKNETIIDESEYLKLRQSSNFDSSCDENISTYTLGAIDGPNNIYAYNAYRKNYQYIGSTNLIYLAKTLYKELLIKDIPPVVISMARHVYLNIIFKLSLEHGPGTFCISKELQTAANRYSFRLLHTLPDAKTSRTLFKGSELADHLLMICEGFKYEEYFVNNIHRFYSLVSCLHIRNKILRLCPNSGFSTHKIDQFSNHEKISFLKKIEKEYENPEYEILYKV